MLDYHFFGKDCFIDKELSNRDNLNAKLNDLNFDFAKVLMLNQIHSNQVIAITDPDQLYGNQNLPKADGIISNQKNIILGIVTADCAPIIFWDDKNQIIGACHAGWRGAFSGIIENTISAMKKIGAKNIKASIGPMIQFNSYEVSQDFFDNFINDNFTNKKFFKSGENKNKWLFDLPNYVYEKILNAEVKEVYNCCIDTYLNEKYHSYRRSQKLYQGLDGRNISVIGYKAAPLF